MPANPTALPPLPPLIVALDLPTPRQAITLATKLNPADCMLKVGTELFTRGGPQTVTALTDMDFAIFLDLKFHDIPNTVAATLTAAADLGVKMVNVHASGGPRMLQAARQSLDQHSANSRPLLLAVTILTSMDDAELRHTGLPGPCHTAAHRLATLAAQAGLDGVVCAASEAAAIKQTHGKNFLTVTPGIRPPGTSPDDQRRTLTPVDARAAGSDFLVIGRPITRAPDPAEAVTALRQQLKPA
ncbi:MAG: orotidine-5'-phosphate decarboxylase [Cellvibrionales bacterium]|nr:orotidine-5'-phosphate decarboxylase [Cellvibrionales bacterium]